MFENMTYEEALWLWVVVAPVVFIALFVFVAPYGRYAQSIFPAVNNRIGFFLVYNTFH